MCASTGSVATHAVRVDRAVAVHAADERGSVPRVPFACAKGSVFVAETGASQPCAQAQGSAASRYTAPNCTSRPADHRRQVLLDDPVPLV